MSHSGLLGVRSLGRRGARLWAALAVSAVMAFAVVAGPEAPDAHAGSAEYFCVQEIAAAWGNCFGNAHNLTAVHAWGIEHSACSNAYLNGFVGEWKCAPTGTWSNAFFDGSRFMTPVIHNNTGSINHYTGLSEFP